MYCRIIFAAKILNKKKPVQPTKAEPVPKREEMKNTLYLAQLVPA
jgi:hypothetical protein